MIFQVSTGRSASLKDQSNFSSATGSSVGSWYGERYGSASASPARTRFRGSKTNMRSRSSMAAEVSKQSEYLIQGGAYLADLRS